MAASSSIRRQILENLDTVLTAIAVGDDYHYTPDKVLIVDPPVMKELIGQAQLGYTLIYFISAGNSTQEHWSSGNFNLDTFEAFIFGSRVYSPQYPDTFDKDDQGEDPKWIPRENMIRDVTRAVLLDINRGALAQNTNITNVRPVEDIKELAERAMFEMRLTIPFKYQWLTP